ncbi:beta-galactosidase [Paractinoplanes abujensis]|uniref:Beta-galactosidase n=1 Tax=Paractinoplanes abujensis TaxID=882441 RepID=A0A7W7CMY2_9ACTN|nr:beta-galactosidase [Actinoplanes abujensis]MBB4691512.1 beta-galactosidase [Actinoplanes abujensis]GID17071.1 beta-galactosidase [Actinoplanes abujensis]
MLQLGCDYNYEQWPPAVWREDMALMREAGVDLVAVNVFGWSAVEPRPGEYDFAALDEIVGLLHDNGIRLNLGTGTASPPPWLTSRHPSVLPVTADGTTRYPGGRQAFCPSSPIFREHALRLVEQVAQRYGRHPALALWHVSNELGCHNALCYCEASAEAFRVWLAARYGTTEALNKAWGTAFWSQRYDSFDEIQPPRLALSVRNPAHLVDFQRFSSDALLDHYRAEAAVLRRFSAAPITTNFMVTAHIRNQDYWSWAADMDVVANDHYLDHRLPDPVAELAFAADLTRGLAGGKPWMLMESATGAVNWQPYNLAKEPGQLLRNTLTHVARGADTICFFQWRASAQGAEKFHSAMLPHAGVDSATWREVLDLSAVLDSLGEVAGTTVQADTALVFSWESWWATDTEARPSQDVRYLEQVHAAYRALRELGVTVDIVAPGSDLTRYRAVVVPCLHMVSDASAAAIAGYVEGGGRAVITFYSGIVDPDDRVRLGGYPGAFRDLLGVVSEEFAPLLPGQSVALASGGQATVWTERLRTTTAEVVEAYADGKPAVTRNQYGAGLAWYVATVLEPAGLQNVLRQAVGDRTGGTSDIEIVRRRGDGRDYVFVVNHGGKDIEHPITGTELVTGQSVTASVLVPAGAVRVVREA